MIEVLLFIVSDYTSVWLEVSISTECLPSDGSCRREWSSFPKASGGLGLQIIGCSVIQKDGDKTTVKNPIYRVLACAFFVACLAHSSVAQTDTWMTEAPAKPAESQPVKKTQPSKPTKPVAEPVKAPTPATEAAPAAVKEPATSESESEPAQATNATLELAQKAQNPISSMVSVPFQYNSNFGVGPNDDTTQILNIQPVVPVALNENLSLVNRAIIPISYIPNSAVPPTLTNGAELGLGDINYQMYFVPQSKPGELIWGVGPTITVPTATADKLGTGKWLAGANAVGLKIKGKWVYGALVNQQWSVAGNSSRPDVSFLTVQPFINRNYSKGWYATTAPIITSNWKAPSGDQWTVPVGGGFGRIFAMGEQKVNVSLAAFGNVVKPTNGPDWNLRFQFTLLFP
jgi:hypothetical protein